MEGWDWWQVVLVIIGFTFGIGGPYVALVLILRMLIRRQMDGHWTLTSEKDKQVKELRETHAAAVELMQANFKIVLEGRDSLVASKTAEATGWHGAHDDLLKAHTLQTEILDEQTDATQYIGLLLQRGAKAPQPGDNSGQEAPQT